MSVGQTVDLCALAPNDALQSKKEALPRERKHRDKSDLVVTVCFGLDRLSSNPALPPKTVGSAISEP